MILYKLLSEVSNQWCKPGLEVVKLEYCLKLKRKHNDGLLADTFSQAAHHCDLF